MGHELRTGKAGKSAEDSKSRRLGSDRRQPYGLGMTSDKNAHAEAWDLEKLYPDYTPEALREAEENLNRYLKHTFENYAWIRQDPERHATLKALTAERAAGRVKERPQKSHSPKR
jgi:hypothetical protein